MPLSPPEPRGGCRGTAQVADFTSAKYRIRHLTDLAGCWLNRRTSRAKANYGTNCPRPVRWQRAAEGRLADEVRARREGEERAFFAKRSLLRGAKRRITKRSRVVG